MFINAIEIAKHFTRPIHTIQRYYGSQEVHPGAATLFFVNADGWALTCGHVADVIIGADQLGKRKAAFIADHKAMQGKKKEKQIYKELEQKYQLTRKSVFEIRNNFVNCIEGSLAFQIIKHPKLDVALIHFTNYSKLLCTDFPVFPRDSSGLKQGKFLCRLGFPFPEFTNFEYTAKDDTINWTSTGRTNTPMFPIEGMLTRHLIAEQSQVVGFELSTPGLRGQSGGPAFDSDGKVWGMQSATKHLDLNFDVNMDVVRNGEKKKVHDSAFLHVGHCIHVDVLKSFMQQHSVTFQEG